MGRIRLLLVLVLSAALVFGVTAFWRFWFLLPYPVAVDCRGKEIDVETVRQWEEREAGRTGALGICGIAGWTIGTEQQIVSVSTGRKGMARIMKVYGSMELAGQGELVCGRYGLPVEGDFCVITESLARELYGSSQVLGEQVRAGKHRMTVAGVTRGKEKILLMPMEEGVIRQLAVEVKGRSQARERVERMME